MTGDLESRLARSYADVGPAPRVRSRVLGGLSVQRAPVARWPLPALVVLGAAVGFAAILALAPEEPEVPPERPRLLLRAEGEAEAVIPVMVARMKDAGIEDVDIRAAGPAGEVEVVLPPAVAPSDVLPLLTRPGTLEFRIVADLPEGQEPPAHWRRLPDAKGGEPVLLEEPEDPRDRFGGEDLDPESIRVQLDPLSVGWIVRFAVREERKGEFGDFTARYIRRQMAIVIDGRVEMAPVIQSKLPGASQISGAGVDGFSREVAEQLAIVLRSGALPVPVRPVDPGDEGR